MSELQLPITPGRYRTAIGSVVVVTRIEPGSRRPVIGHLYEGNDWDARGLFTDEGGLLRLVERLPDSLPDSSAEKIERLERQNERLRAANRLLAITRDCCANEVIRLRERVETLELNADWAEQSAVMHERETDILREQMTAHGVEPRVGLTITGEIVRVPDALPDSVDVRTEYDGAH